MNLTITACGLLLQQSHFLPFITIVTGYRAGVPKKSVFPTVHGWRLGEVICAYDTLHNKNQVNSCATTLGKRHT